MKPLIVWVILFGLAAISCTEQTLITSDADANADDAVVEYFDPDVPAQTQTLDDGVYIEPGLHLRPGITIHEVDPSFDGEIRVEDAAGTAEFTGASVSEVEGIEEGDILITSQIIARVARVEQSPDGVLVELEDFQIWEVVHGDWSIELPLDVEGDAFFSVDPEDYMTRRQMLSQTFDLSISAEHRGVEAGFGASMTYRASPKMVFEGKIPFYESSSDYSCSDPQVEANFGCVFGKCAKRFRYCVDHLLLSIEVGTDFSADASLKATAPLAEEKFPEEERFRDVALGFIPLAGPFTLRPTLYIDRQAYAKVLLEGELSVEAGTGVTVPLGFEYRNGSGISMLPNSQYPVTSYANFSGEASLQARLEAGVWGEAGLELGICTPNIGADVCVTGLQAGGRVTVKAVHEDGVSTSQFSSDDHCLSASADFSAIVRGKAEARVSATVLGYSFSKSATLFKAEFSPYSRTIASWNGGGRYCSGEHEQRLGGMNALFDRDDVDCEDQEDNPLVGTCAEEFMKPCFDPTGTCEGRVYEDGSFDMEWSTGERVYRTVTESEQPSDSPISIPTAMEGDYFGADDSHCAEDTVEVSTMSGGPVPGCRSTTVLTLLEDVEQFDGRYLPGDELVICELESGATRFTCPDEDPITVEAGDDRGICLVGGACTFELGFLDDLDENRDLTDDPTIPDGAM